MPKTISLQLEDIRQMPNYFEGDSENVHLGLTGIQAYQILDSHSFSVGTYFLQRDGSCKKNQIVAQVKLNNTIYTAFEATDSSTDTGYETPTIQSIKIKFNHCENLDELENAIIKKIRKKHSILLEKLISFSSELKAMKEYASNARPGLLNIANVVKLPHFFRSVHQDTLDNIRFDLSKTDAAKLLLAFNFPVGTYYLHCAENWLTLIIKTSLTGTVAEPFRVDEHGFIENNPTKNTKHKNILELEQSALDRLKQDGLTMLTPLSWHLCRMGQDSLAKSPVFNGKILNWKLKNGYEIDTLENRIAVEMGVLFEESNFSLIFDDNQIVGVKGLSFDQAIAAQAKHIISIYMPNTLKMKSKMGKEETLNTHYLAQSITNTISGKQTQSEIKSESENENSKTKCLVM